MAPNNTPRASTVDGNSTDSTDELLRAAGRLDLERLQALVRIARDMSKEARP